MADISAAGTPRVIAALVDLCIACSLIVWVESAIGIDAAGYSESLIAVGVGFLFLTFKDCVGGISPGKGLTGCVVIDQSGHQPVSPQVALRRNGRLYGSAAAILLASFGLGIAAGEAVGVTVGAIALIGLLSFFADRGDHWDGTMVVLRKDFRRIRPTRPPPAHQSASKAPQTPDAPLPDLERESNAEQPIDSDTLQMSLSDMLELLGLSLPFSMTELRKSYRTAISEYHPDRLSHLAKELQAIGEKRSKQINFAYKHLRSHASSP